MIDEILADEAIENYIAYELCGKVDWLELVDVKSGRLIIEKYMMFVLSVVDDNYVLMYHPTDNYPKMVTGKIIADDSDEYGMSLYASKMQFIIEGKQWRLIIFNRNKAQQQADEYLGDPDNAYDIARDDSIVN